MIWLLGAILVTLGSLSTQAAQAAGKPVAESIPSTLDARYLGTDVASWVTGERYGTVTDEAGPMARELQSLLMSAKHSVDLAMYGVEEQSWVFGVLRDLRRRGVKVRAVIDQQSGEYGDWRPANFMYRDTPRLLRILGRAFLLPDLGPSGRPRASSIMHDKFAVIDAEKVWVGSANLTTTCLGSEYNANDALIVQSPQLAGLYTDEFAQMFTNRRFSTAKLLRSSHRPLQFKDGSSVQVFFAPQDDPLRQAVIPFIQGATSTLDVAMFYLTDANAVAALIAARKRGVEVRVILDALAAAHPSSPHKELRAAGINVRVENWGGKMHMKTAVADGRDLLMGSLNWSVQGNRSNDENIVVIKGKRPLAGSAVNRFAALWDLLPDDEYDARAESLSSVNSCFDGLDNDYDGLTDSEDEGCQSL